MKKSKAVIIYSIPVLGQTQSLTIVPTMSSVASKGKTYSHTKPYTSVGLKRRA